MRDAEFQKTFKEVSLRLEMFFSTRIKKTAPRADKAVLVEDLVQLTAMEALEYSRNPDYASYSIESLLFQKAEKIWGRYKSPPKKKIIGEPLKELEEDSWDNIDAQQKMALQEAVEIIRGMADEKTWLALTRREQGFEDFEIAIEIGTSLDNLRQKIHRLRIRIQEKYKSWEFF